MGGFFRVLAKGIVGLLVLLVGDSVLDGRMKLCTDDPDWTSL